jgi:hypothetical protein
MQAYMKSAMPYLGIMTTPRDVNQARHGGGTNQPEF